MAPHDLLCKWCSTFVGRGKKFCSIFCEARFTKNRRRKHITRRPVPDDDDREIDLPDFDTPTSKVSVQTAPIQSDGLMEALASNTKTSSQRYSTQKNEFPSEDESNTKEKTVLTEPLPDFVTDMTSGLTLQETADAPKQTKTAAALARRVRSSGYGAPVNPKLRPMSLKPRSATMRSAKREGSAQSRKSAKGTIPHADISREESRLIETGRGANWELVSTIMEEAQPDNPDENKEILTDAVPTLNAQKVPPLENLGQTSRSTERVRDCEIVRESTEESDILDQSVLQVRLSCIKRKVETVRRRGRESRSSITSDVDTNRWDDSYNSDTLNTSSGTTYSSANTSSSGQSPERAGRHSVRVRSTKLF